MVLVHKCILPGFRVERVDNGRRISEYAELAVLARRENRYSITSVISGGLLMGDGRGRRGRLRTLASANNLCTVCATCSGGSSPASGGLTRRQSVS